MRADSAVQCTYEPAIGLFPEPDEFILRDHNLAEVSTSLKPISTIGHD
jgi:hypothetical protein